MSLELLMGIAGCLVTVMVIAGMVLLTPRNLEGGTHATPDVDGAQPARARVPDRG